MAGDALNGRGDPSILGIHGRSPLATGPGGGLGKEALRGRILRLGHLSRHQVHLMGISGRLGRIRRRSPLLVAREHAIVHGGWLGVGGRVKLVHLHRVSSLRRGVGMGCLGRALLAGSLCLLLLLDPRRDGFLQRSVLEIHRRHKGPCEFLLRDERM